MQPRKQCTNEEQHTTKVQRFSGPRRRPRSTKPPPITLGIRRFASTGSQESNAPTKSKTPLRYSDFLGPASDHGAHKTTTGWGGGLGFRVRVVVVVASPSSSSSPRRRPPGIQRFACTSNQVSNAPMSSIGFRVLGLGLGLGFRV